MDISSSYTLSAPREQVWDALFNPDLLKRAIPGCESLEPTGANQYALRLNVDVAGVKGIYQGTMRILDAQKPESYRVVVDGAGARGILHSDGVLRLQANDAGTTDIHYTGQAQLGGPVASIGAQVARGAASMLLKRFFARIASLLPAEPAAAAASVASVASVAAPIAASATPEIAEAPAPPVAATPAEPPPSVAPADIPPAVADSAPMETFTIPTPASAVRGLYAPPPPAAPVSESPPPAPAKPSATPAPLAESGIERQRGSAGAIGVIIAVLAVVVVVIVVLVVVGAFR